MNRSAGRGVALTGAGLISDIHISGLRRIGVEIRGIADADLERARRKAEQHGIPRAFASQDEMLRDTQADAVHVLTPPGTHAGLVIEALEAGADVYVEKPFANSEPDCAAMIDAARRTGRSLCVGHCMVYDPLMQRVLGMIESGEIGRVVHATGVYVFDAARVPDLETRAWYRRLSGGFIEDLMSHPASLLLRVIGAPRSVTGALDHAAERDHEGIAALVSGERATGALFVSVAARPEEVSLEVRGTRGTLRANFSSMVLTVQRERGLPRKIAHGFRNFEMAGQLATQTVTSTARFLAKRIDPTKGIHSLIAEFHRARSAGEPAPVSGEEGLHVVRLTRTLWPEAETNRPRTTREQIRMLAAGDRRTALVTGATGFIGTHLVRTLLGSGTHVRALARDGRRARALQEMGAEVVFGDMSDPSTTAGLCEGIDHVYHLASVMRGRPETFERVDLDGGRRLIDEAKRAHVQRFVFTSTMGAFALADARDGAVVTEEMSDSPDRVGPYARAKLLLEEMLREATRAGDLAAVCTRPGLVFGPGLSPYLEHLPHLGTRRGDRYIIFGDGNVPLALTYVGNTVDALLLCATVDEAIGETFTIVDDDLPTQREYVARLAELTGRPLRVTTIPRAAAWTIGAGVEGLAALMRIKPPTSRRLLTGKTRKIRFDCTRAKRVLGWTPRVHWEEGLRRAVEWERRRSEEPVPAEGDGRDAGEPTPAATVEV